MTTISPKFLNDEDDLPLTPLKNRRRSIIKNLAAPSPSAWKTVNGGASKIMSSTDSHPFSGGGSPEKG